MLGGGGELGKVNWWGRVSWGKSELLSLRSVNGVNLY